MCAWRTREARSSVRDKQWRTEGNGECASSGERRRVKEERGEHRSAFRIQDTGNGVIQEGGHVGALGSPGCSKGPPRKPTNGRHLEKYQSER